MVDQQRHQLHIEFWNATPHFQTSVEIALRDFSEGHQVSFASWGRYFSSTEIYHGDISSIKNEDLVLNNLGLLGIRLCAMPSREFPFQQAEKLVADCKNIYQLETMKYLNMPLGHIVRSYLVDKFKTTNPSLAFNRALVVNAVCDLINIYHSTIMEIKRTSANRIIVFNGRYLGPSAVRFAAEKCGIDVFYHERGPDKNRFILFPEPVHSCGYWWNLLQDTWRSKAISSQEALESGKNLFLQRSSGATTNWLSFTNNQNKAPIIPSDCSYTITYFSSSPYEYGAIYDKTLRPNGLFNEEFALFFFLQDFAITNPKVNVVIRMHPNLVHSNNSEKAVFAQLSKQLSKTITIYPPESDVNSYSLLENSDVVVTSGSTCGVEGLCLGKKVINLAPALYSYLDCVFEPETLSDFNDELLNPFDINHHKAVLQGYQYFYSYSRIGTPFVYYTPHDLFSGVLKLPIHSLPSSHHHIQQP